MVSFTSTNEEKIVVSIIPETAKDKVSKVEGIPQWSIISGLSNINPSADGLSCEFISQDIVDTNPNNNITIVSVTGDADLGTGIISITETFEYTVTLSQATKFVVTVGAPVDKP